MSIKSKTQFSLLDIKWLHILRQDELDTGDLSLVFNWYCFSLIYISYLKVNSHQGFGCDIFRVHTPASNCCSPATEVRSWAQINADWLKYQQIESICLSNSLDQDKILGRHSISIQILATKQVRLEVKTLISVQILPTYQVTLRDNLLYYEN